MAVHRLWLLRVFAALAGLSVLSVRPFAQPSRQHDLEAHVVVRDDRTYRATQTVRTKVLTDAGLAAAQSANVLYIHDFETLAFTAASIERDGEVMPVDITRVDVRTAGAGQNPDQRTLILQFPDVKVGDTIVYTTVRDTRETALRGHFSYAWTFARAEPWGRARHTIEANHGLELHVDASATSSLRYEKTTGQEGRAAHVFSYDSSGTEVFDEAGAVAAIDRDPGFAITTFANHAEFALAYWQEAAPQLAVTPRIAALAAEITRGQMSPRDKAVAIDLWMKRTIRYQAQYLGRERWTPRAAEAVLSAQAGDCKDHAVLASALLEAVGLESEHVLVNLGTSYSLPKLPPAAFNHVIVHVPAAALTLDPSATLAAAGTLAPGAYDKPAVHVGAAGARLMRTAPMQAAEHTTVARTKLMVASNGAISGETIQSATGIFATSARGAVLRFQAAGFPRAAQQRLAALGTSGSGTFDATSPSELREPYVVKATFALSDLADLPLTGHRRLPVGLPVHARPGQFLLGPRIADRRLPFVCFAGTQSEETSITFAPGLALPRVPPPRRIVTSAFTFEASYELDGRTFHARRTFTSTVQGQVCPPGLASEIDAPMKEVFATLGTMLSFPGFGPTGSNRPRP